MLMFKVAGTLLLLSPAIVNSLYLPTGVDSSNGLQHRHSRELSQATIDRIENIANLLIGIDESVDREIEQQNIHLDHFYMQKPSRNSNDKPGSIVAPNDQELAAEAGTVGVDNIPQEPVPSEQEEKFSVVLADLKQVADSIREGITKANQNRQFRLVLRLRPLLNYVNQIQHNMEMLRTRVVAIATLSNLTESVSEVIDQFGDVMTSSLGLASSLIPAAAVPSSGSGLGSASLIPDSSTNDKRKPNTSAGGETIRNQHRRPARPQATSQRRQRPTQKPAVAPAQPQAVPAIPIQSEIVSKSEIPQNNKKPEIEAQSVQQSSIQKDSEKIFKNVVSSKFESEKTHDKR